MPLDKHRLYAWGYAGILAIGATILFFGSETLIPETIPIVGILGGITALIIMFFALLRWRQIVFGTKTQKGKGWKAAAIFLPVLILVGVYLLYVAEIIPNTIPVVQYGNDIIAVLLGAFVIGKIIQSQKAPKK